MHTSTLLTLLTTASFALAAPAAEPIKIGVDDVILYSNSGRYSIMKRDDLQIIQDLRANKTLPPKPAYLSGYHSPPNSTTGAGNSSAAPVVARADNDGSVRLIVPSPPQDFLGWDVIMSAVVKGSPTTLSVTSGYSIANTVSVGVSSQFTLVKDFLSATMSVSYDMSWTSTTTQQFSSEVPAGKYGAFVCNPRTHRESGVVFEGKIGEEGTSTYYQGDSFASKSYAGLEWVDGVILLCTGDEFPLKRCVGDGTL
ncbi:hypothetical protein DM02DRAFT_668243 [Periconia macrospinosa]|uniref:Celp0028 effector like protein n=1 Tax=Periconia macrospinosa TaxID=97972 RepID=A0A2V1E7H3_9PLEO|nr:hypothetical protein DM02DRAFT_668243 [Periconia macrospinosa]